MAALLSLDDIGGLAPAGYYIALRVGFAFPVEEINALPGAWVEFYTRNRFILSDPMIRWAYTHTGVTSWDALVQDDPVGVVRHARAHGLRYGVTVSVFDDNLDGQRSFGNFARSDRDFTDLEVKALRAYVQRRHAEMAPPTNLTRAELEALGMVKDGKRLKEIAFDLGVTEGAVKQRLKNAKIKIGAKTSTQAAAIAAQHGLV